MSTVVQFPNDEGKHDLLIYVCDCGCASFKLLSDGTHECTGCNDVSSDCGAGWCNPDAKETVPLSDVRSSAMGNGCTEFARLHMAKEISADNAILAVVAFEDSRVLTWSVAETQDELDWVGERLRDASFCIRGGE